tara:strand:- start:412 stop:1776 length:1365 start_codon:yes stop_codon:yes gene_type:complete
MKKLTLKKIQDILATLKLFQNSFRSIANSYSRDHYNLYLDTIHPEFGFNENLFYEFKSLDKVIINLKYVRSCSKFLEKLILNIKLQEDSTKGLVFEKRIEKAIKSITPLIKYPHGLIYSSNKELSQLKKDDSKDYTKIRKKLLDASAIAHECSNAITSLTSYVLEIRDIHYKDDGWFSFVREKLRSSWMTHAVCKGTFNKKVGSLSDLCATIQAGNFKSLTRAGFWATSTESHYDDSKYKIYLNLKMKAYMRPTRPLQKILKHSEDLRVAEATDDKEEVLRIYKDQGIVIGYTASYKSNSLSMWNPVHHFLRLTGLRSGASSPSDSTVGIFFEALAQVQKNDLFIGPLNPFLLRILAYDEREVSGKFFIPHRSILKSSGLTEGDKPKKMKFVFGIRRFVPEMISCITENIDPSQEKNLHSSHHWSDDEAKKAVAIAIPESSGRFRIYTKEEFEK